MKRFIPSLKILESGYQRNGISGEGFVYFKIQFDDEMGNRERIGIATMSCDDHEKDEPFNGSCRVVTPDNLENHWRGDNFEYDLRAMRKEWNLFPKLNKLRKGESNDV
jgi:hypothetical protein